MAIPEVRVYKKTPQEALRLHIFAPLERPAACAVVFFMCGGWTAFTPKKHYPQSEYFARRGAVAMVAEVRVIGRHGTTATECVVDAKSAIRWVRQHAAELQVPEDRIVASGGSAAGHVSLCAAMVEGFEESDEDGSVSSVPDIVCVFNPAVIPRDDDCRPLSQRVRMRIEKFGSIERIRALSPTRAIRPELPPVLIMHGDRDDITPLPESAVFADEMKAAGNECRLVTYEGQGHGFFNYHPDGNPFYEQTVADMDAFLTGHGFLPDYLE